MFVLCTTNDPFDFVVTVNEPMLVVVAFVSVNKTIEVVFILALVTVTFPPAPDSVPVPRLKPGAGIYVIKLSTIACRQTEQLLIDTA